MIRAGANINSIDNDGWTPLHAAAHWNQHHVIKYFIEKNADLDTINYAVNKNILNIYLFIYLFISFRDKHH